MALFFARLSLFLASITFNFGEASKHWLNCQPKLTAELVSGRARVDRAHAHTARDLTLRSRAKLISFESARVEDKCARCCLNLD